MIRYKAPFLVTGMSIHLAGAGLALLMLILLTRSTPDSGPEIDIFTRGGDAATMQKLTS